MRFVDATHEVGRGVRAAARGRAVYQTGPTKPLLLAWLAAACAGPPATDGSEPRLERFERAEAQMGTTFRIVGYATDRALAERAIAAAFARVAALDASMSDYDRQSELSLLSRDAVAAPVEVSDDLFAVLRLARELSVASDGAFDVTVGPAVVLWRRARRQGALPTDARLRDAMAAVGWQNVELDETGRRVRLAVERMRLDLGGIAKGYAAQRALDELSAHGIRRALVDAGGDVVVGDPPPGEDGWLIALGPLEVAPERAGAAPREAIRVARCAVATSGDLFQFVEIDGVRYAHIVDPRTGLGLTGRRAATVVVPAGPVAGAVADALASAACVLEPERAIEVVESFGGASVLVRRAGDRSARELASTAFPAREPAPVER